MVAEMEEKIESCVDPLSRANEDHDLIIEKFNEIFEANDHHNQQLNERTVWGGLNKNALDEMWTYASDEELEFLKNELIKEREIYRDSMLAINKLQGLCEDFMLASITKEKLYESLLAEQGPKLIALEEDCIRLKEELKKEQILCQKTKSAMYKLLHMDKKSALANVVHAVEAREKETREILMSKHDAEKQLLSKEHEKNISRLSIQHIPSTMPGSAENLEEKVAENLDEKEPLQKLEMNQISIKKQSMNSNLDESRSAVDRSSSKASRFSAKKKISRHQSMPPIQSKRRTEEEENADAALVQQVLDLCQRIDDTTLVAKKEDQQYNECDETKTGAQLTPDLDMSKNCTESKSHEQEMPGRVVISLDQKYLFWVIVVAALSAYFAIH